MKYINSNESTSYGIAIVLICILAYGVVYYVGEKYKHERLDFQARCFDAGGEVIVHTGDKDRCFSKEIILEEYYKEFSK